jgi:putative FmdB family regulatory protein
MPFYEFFCPDCNVNFTFFSRRVNTETLPDCPKCYARKLDRRISLFAVRGNAKNPSSDDSGDSSVGDLPIDEAKMARAMEALAGEADHISDDGPRQAANLMRKFSDMTGLRYTDTINDALTRLETGENPEAIEAQLGDALDSDNPFILPDKLQKPKAASADKRRPTTDDTIYEL